MRLRIRDYRRSDRPHLVACLNSMLDHLASVDPWHRVIRTSEHGTLLAAALLSRVKRRRGFILIAESGGHSVGVAVAWISPVSKLERTENKPTMPGYLSDLAVLPEWRGKGIGTRLLREVERRFRKAGCDVMTLGVFGANVGAFRLYEREGYAVRGMFLGKELAEPKLAWPSKASRTSRL